MSFQSGVKDQVSSTGVKSLRAESIRLNPNNFYAQTSDEHDLTTEMMSLLKDGQLSSILVYPDEGDDGKKYTLLSGERRVKAILRLAEEGSSDGMVLAKIIDKPKDKEDEMLAIISCNAQRNKSKEIKSIEVHTLNKIWSVKKAKGETTGRFRDWAAGLLGISPRSVANYLKDYGLLDTDECESSQESVPGAISNVDLLSDQLKELLKEMAIAMEEIYPDEVSFKVNPSLAVTVKAKDTSKIRDLLAELGLDAVFDDYEEKITSLNSRLKAAQKDAKRG